MSEEFGPSQSLGLTGCVRMSLRKRWFREPLIIIQVQEQWTANGGMTAVDCWRDARFGDICELGAYLQLSHLAFPPEPLP